MSNDSGIYRINLGNGYFYIGSAVFLERRKKNHIQKLRKKQHRNSIMQKCWEKYGIFEFIVLETCSKDDLLKREQELLDKHFDDEKNVNIARSASAPFTGRKHSNEAKKKISAFHKGKVVSPEHRRSLSESRIGKPLLPHHKEKVIATNKNRVWSEETRQKLSKSLKGRVVSKETRKKLSDASKGRVFSDEHRKKLSIQKKNRPPMLDEHRRQMSIATRGKPKSAETRQKMRDAWVLRRARSVNR